MPDKSSFLFLMMMLGFGNLICYRIGGVILITPQNLEFAVPIVGDGIKSNEHMRHRNREEFFDDFSPFIYRIIIEISPVKEKFSIKLFSISRIGKIECLFWRHCYKDLYQGKDPCKHSFFVIFLDLGRGLIYGDSALFEFDMNDWHSIDQKKNVSPPIRQNFIFLFKFWLFDDLINTRSSGDFLSIIDVKSDFLATVERVVRVVPSNRDRHRIDKITIEI
jgi:hypothetical protein